MYISSASVTAAALLAAGLSQAQYLINELSFGHAGRIGRPEAPYQIPHFNLMGQPRNPEVLSNKVVLTPISPGNHRAALWGTTPLTHASWESDVDFRASGPERGGGNLNIWLVRNGHDEVGDNSVYTVGKFDGLVLVIDMHGGTGMLRGFLNDGSVDYHHHHNIDTLAFGHCQLPYRNLGRPSQIKLRHSSTNFKVEVDGKPCFETDKVRIPAGNFFGISGATPDTPDSFEIFKLTVMSQPNDDNNAKMDKQGSHVEYQSRQHMPDKSSTKQQSGGVDDFETIADQDAEIFQTSKAQFSDLHNRLQLTTHQIAALQRAVTKHHQMDEQRHEETRQLFASLKDIAVGIQATLTKLDSIGDLQRKVNDLERDIQGMRSDMSRKMMANEQNVKSYLTDHHATLSQTMLESMPGHGKLIFVFIGLQVFLVGSYILYKRRRASMPKKYL